MNRQTFKEACKEKGIVLTEEKLDRLERYMELLLEWNEKMNLTAITDPEEIWEKHFYDSVIPFRNVSFKTFCDVGSGAGFPAIPMKICFEQTECTLLEPIAKRCRFLETVIRELGLQNVRVENVRAEDFAKTMREHFDCISARAVARLPILLELCAPLCKVDGTLVFLKGRNGMQELEEAGQAVEILNLTFERCESVSVQDAVHENLYFKKHGKTSNRYPRNYSQIKKKPLGG